MRIIVPCCGRSTRYATETPKWLLPAHDGRPMVALALQQLDVGEAEVVVTVLREHEDRFAVTRGLREVFNSELRVVILDEPTKSQAETVARTLEALGGDAPFLVKDSDNCYGLSELAQEYNYVCVDSLNEHDSINPRNKSYVQVDHQDLITNIREKVVISDLFSVGGYHFASAQAFLERFRLLESGQTPWRRECYISDIIGSMILDGVPFKARRVSAYQDWGTIHEWKRALKARQTFFVQLDGFVFQRGSRYFEPRFPATRLNTDVAASLKRLAASGHSIVYLSVRPAAASAATEAQIKSAELPSGSVLYDCPVSPWTLVTAPHDTLPFQTARALELSPGDENLEEKLSEPR